MPETAVTVGSEIWITLNWLLGLDEDVLSVHHMVFRALIVFLFALLIVRVASKRFIGGNTAFDMVLGVMIGSVISRAITGQSPFFATLCASITLVVLHAFLGKVAFRFGNLGTVIKGQTRVLIRDGKVDWDAMRRSDLSENDLLEALRLRSAVADWEDVKEARLERNGEISVVHKRSNDT